MSAQSSGASASISPSVFTAEESSLVDRALRLIESKRLNGMPVFHYQADFNRYLVLRFGGLVVEEFHVLYLDLNHCLLSAERVAVGDKKSVAPNLRHVAYRAIALGADSVVLAHNHPNNSPNPSDADIHQLYSAERALGWLNINLLDSFVVTSSGITSIMAVSQQREEAAQRRKDEEELRLRQERSDKMRAARARKAVERAAMARSGEARHAA